MHKLNQFYINGEWQDAGIVGHLEITNPATGGTIGEIAMGNADHINQAVAAAKEAFKTFSKTTKKERLGYLERMLELYNERYDDIADAIRQEMGAPKEFSKTDQAFTGRRHITTAIEALKNIPLSEDRESYQLRHEPIGVCGLITPWNWPINQIACKVPPAIAAGCTMVLKPSEFSPLSAKMFAEIIHDSSVPKGVFNMVFGDGPTVGATLSEHPDVDMISFTGSTRAGIAIAQAAAPTIKRVSQELGGKSPVILTDDIDLEKVVPNCVWLCMENTGQSCNAGTRLLVPAKLHDQVVDIAVKATAGYKTGNPLEDDTDIGPLANKGQFEKVKAILEEAEKHYPKPVIGGAGPVEGLDADHENGFFVKPTIYAGLDNDHMIAKQEVFGPVLAILPYETLDEAIEIANDTPYGLSSYIYSNDDKTIDRLTSELRTGMVHVNGASLAPMGPFGGYKQSGNGREWGQFGLEEFLEIKSVLKK